MLNEGKEIIYFKHEAKNKTMNQLFFFTHFILSDGSWRYLQTANYFITQK